MKDKTKQKQQGSIIIYAVFLMVVLSAIVSLMAFLVFVSIRSSTNSKRAVSAFYAAESGLEKSLYIIETSRDSQLLETTLASLNSTPITTLSSSRSSYALAANNDETTTLNFALPIGQSKQIDIFNPDSGAPVISGSSANVYLTWNKGSDCVSETCNTGNLEYSYKSFNDVTIGITASDSDYTTYVISCADTSCFSDGDYSLLPDWGHQIKLKPVCCDLEDVSVSIGYSPSDLVSFNNYIVIRSTGVNGKSSVKLQANTIWKPPLSGLGEFVLFSEESITK